MNLWTIQSKAVVELLEKNQVVYGKPDFADLDGDVHTHFKDAYTWMHSQMLVRLPEIATVDWQWPVWAWHTPCYRTKSGAPHMRYYKEKNDDTYLLELDVPDDKVLLSCFELWHGVLNKWTLDLFDGEPIDMRESWQRIFSVDAATATLTLEGADPDWLNTKDLTIQACLWAIYPSDVKSIKHYNKASK